MTEPLRNHGDHGGATAVNAVQAPRWHRAESGSIPLRNWIFLLIPSPIPELELNWNWLYPVQAELELNWNCHHLNWNWSRNCVLRNWIRNCLHGIEIRYEVPHISVAYNSTRLAQVVYTLLVHIDSTKEIRGQLCNCSHNNETVGSYQPFHDQVGHGLTITGQWCFLREAKSPALLHYTWLNCFLCLTSRLTYCCPYVCSTAHLLRVKWISSIRVGAGRKQGCAISSSQSIINGSLPNFQQ